MYSHYFCQNKLRKKFKIKILGINYQILANIAIVNSYMIDHTYLMLSSLADTLLTIA